MKNLVENVIYWARERNLIEGSTAKDQFLKLVEEMSEYDIDPMDSIGDTYVVLIIMCEQLNLSFLELYENNTMTGEDPLEALGKLAKVLARKKDPKEALMLVIATNNLAADVDRFEHAKCLEMAWNEIKHRKGKMVDGVFVKEADLEQQ